MRTKRYTIFCLLIFSCCTSFLFAQTLEEQMIKSHPNCQSKYMNAMDLLPKLYGAQSYDSLEKAVDIWERSCSDIPEVSIIRMLLAMEEEKFTFSQHVTIATIELLNNYASAFVSPGSMQSLPTYKESGNSFFKFSTLWSTSLLENKKLDENEIFICKVLTGEIKHPEKEIEKNPQIYPDFTVLIKKHFEVERLTVRGNIALSTGVWLPNNNLSTLGVHPSFGLHAGVRNVHHQIDISMQIRYLESANTYAVKRDGQIDSTNYYVGGYIGLDYVYYLVSKTKYDVGILAGMGWDGFDFAPQPHNYYYDYPYYTSHETIGSFNANAGLRFNYYFTHSFYVGLQGRYNGINYSTHGGTNLSGDAVSIDLIFGYNGSKNLK